MADLADLLEREDLDGTEDLSALIEAAGSDVDEVGQLYPKVRRVRSLRRFRLDSTFSQRQSESKPSSPLRRNNSSRSAG